MAGRMPHLFGSVLTLTGAFAIGGVIHGVAVEGTVRPLSPIAVGGVVLGGVLIVAGRRLEQAFDPSEYVHDPDREEDDEVDEELSPVPEGAMEGREADEEYGDR